MMVFLLMVLHVLAEPLTMLPVGFILPGPPAAALAGFLSRTGLSQGTLEAGYRGVWWLHYLVILGLWSIFPLQAPAYSCFPCQCLLQTLGPKVVIEPVPLEGVETFGASKIQDFTWKDLLTFMPVPYAVGAMSIVLPS